MSFFDDKKAAAVLKHAILDKYLIPYAMKTGKFAPAGRVAFVDGYAGEGRYDGGEEGSPALALRAARTLAGKRALECIFVEADKIVFIKLSAVVEAEKGACAAACLTGELLEHLDYILSATAGIPAFFFLDPYGLMIPFEDVVKIFTRRPSGFGEPATEVLINFNASAIRRIGGYLTSPKEFAGRDLGLARMDAVCGGSWWRDDWTQHDDKDEAEEAIVRGYARRLGQATGCGGWTTDVRNRDDLKPVYHLVFLTRHRDGMHLFGEALSSALEVWRRTVLTQELGDSILDVNELLSDREERLASLWVSEIYVNLKSLLAEGKSFVISDRYREVYGAATGKAREKHLRKAWKQLHAEGLTKTDSKSNLLSKMIEPA
jgi:three-Cys-motif partner protein